MLLAEDYNISSICASSGAGRDDLQIISIACYLETESKPR